MERNEDFPRDRDDLDKSIRSGDKKAVQRLIDKYPNEKFDFNSDNQSAAAIAILSHQIEIYEVLIASGLSLAPHENVEEIVKHLSAAKKTEIRNINRLYFKDPNLQHLSSLISKSRTSLSANTNNRREQLEMIHEAFEELNDIKSIVPLLKVVASSDKLKIIFDFDHRSVEHMDPTLTTRTTGVSYRVAAFVYIGAKGLKDDQQKFDVLGVMAHELCHYAMNLLYNNKCNPYKIGDEKYQEEFQNIAMICKRKGAAERYIEAVFDGSDHEHAELIVRVPHLLALYKTEPERLEEIQETFKDLFEFFETKTLPDLQAKYPLMRAALQIKEINDHCDLQETLASSKNSFLPGAALKLDFTQFTAVLSNCPKLTVQRIYQQFKDGDNFESSVVFVTLESLKIEKIFGLLRSLFTSCESSKVIINCDNQKDDDILLISTKLRREKIDSRTVIVYNNEMPAIDIHCIQHNQLWTQLTTATKELFMKSQIMFQGNRMQLGEVAHYDSLENVNLESLLKEKCIIAKALIFDDVKFIIERKFTAANTPTVELTIDDLIANADKKKVILISDEPGEKSTEFKMIAKILKSKFPTRWIVFFDLREFEIAYELDWNISKNFGTICDISKYFGEKILKINGMEAEIFTKLFIDGSIIFVVDGFEGISQSFKDFNLQLLKEIQVNTQNLIWISTRPQLERDFEKRFFAKAYTLKPLTKSEKYELLNHFFRSNEIDKLSTMERVRLSENENTLQSTSGNVYIYLFWNAAITTKNIHLIQRRTQE